MEKAGKKRIAHSGAQVVKYPQWPEKFAKFADFFLQSSDGYEFGVSKIVLLLKSDDFAAVFDANTTETGVGRAVLPDLTGDGLFEVLSYIYEGKLTGNFENVADQVYSAAQKYNVAGLKEICVKQLYDQMFVDSICVTVELAKKFGRKRLLTDSLKFIKTHQADPEMPWDQLAELFDGKILKEMVAVEYDDDEDN